MLKFRSVSSIVIAAAKTGRASKRRKAVTKTDQTNKGIVYIAKPRALILIIVTIKLIAPKIEDAPDKCRLKIAKSTDGPECACIPDRGG